MQISVVYQCNILLVGPSSAGKHSLVERLSCRTFGRDFFQLPGCEYQAMLHQIDNQQMKVYLWEYQEIIYTNKIPNSFCREADGVFLTFDICKESSFQGMKKFHDQLLGKGENLNEDVQFALIGCKSDLESKREVPQDVALTYAESYGIPYFETSAKTGTNCTEALNCLARKILISMKKKHPYIHLKKKKIQNKRTTCF